MAPGLRSGCAGRHRAEPGGGCCGGGGGCTEDAAAGEWRCLRGRCRAGAAVELRHCLLTVGMLSLLTRCAVAAAEEKSTYDASGSSSLLSDPAATAAPAHPSTGLSVAEEVPFLAARSDGDSEPAGGGLSGQPAFSSVLTVMAGTVKHPVSLDQSRTSPTISKDETHTTKWPSHSSSGSGSEMSSSSSYVRDRIPASSGLTPSMPHQQTSPLQAVTMLSPSHVSVFMDGEMNVSSFSSSTASPPSRSLLPSPAPSTSSVLLSLLALSPSTELMNKAPSSQGQRIVFSAVRPTESVTFSPAMPLSRTDSLTATRSVEQGRRRASSESSRIRQQLYSTSDITHRVLNSKVIKAPAISSYTTSYSSSNTVHDPFKVLVKPTETQNSVSANNWKNTILVPANQESQAVGMRQELSQDPTSALSSGDVAQQMVHGTAYAGKTDDGQTFVHGAVTSHTVNPTVSPAVTFKPTGSFLTVSSGSTAPGAKSLSETAITYPTTIDSGMVSLEHSSNRGDLVMASGHGHPAVSVINIKNKPARAELESISTQAHQNNSLSHTKARTESTRSGAASFTTESLHLQSKVTTNLQQFLTQKTPSAGKFPKHTVWTTLKIFPSDSGTVSLSGSALPAGSAKYMTHKSVREHFPQPSRPTYPLPLFRSHSPIHSTDEGPTGSSEVNFAAKTKMSSSPAKRNPAEKPVQATPFLTFPHEFYTTSGLMPYDDKSQQTLSSGEVSPYHKKSEGAGLSKPLTFKVQTNAGNSKSSPSSTVGMLYGKSSVESLDRNTAETSVSPLFNGKDESTLMKSTVFYTRSVPLGQSTTQFPSLMTTDGALMVNKGPNKGSPTELSFSQVTFDGGLGASISLAGKDSVTVMGPHERSSSSWSEITITTLRTDSPQRAQGPVVIVSSNKSKLYSGTETANPSTASSAAAISSSDGQNSIETAKPMLSFGTKLMAPYKKWKATKPVSFQSSAFDSEMTPSGFDRASSNLIPDGPSYEHPNLEDRQEHNMHILNSNDPTGVASDPYSVPPSVGGYPPLTYGKGTTDYKEWNMTLSLADLKLDAALSSQQTVTANTGAPPVWGPDTLPTALSYVTTNSVTSRDTPLALAYKSVATRLPDKPVHTDHVRDTLDSELTSPREPMLSTPETSSQTPSDASSPSLFSAFRVSSLNVDLTTSESSRASSLLSPSSSSSGSADVLLSSKPSIFSAIESTPPPPSPDTSSSHPIPDSECSKCTTDVSVVLTEAGTGELNTGTSRAVALPFLKEKEVHLSPSQSARTTLPTGPSERTSQVPPLRLDTTTASVKLASTNVASTAKTKNTTTSMPSPNVTTGTTQSITTTTTTQPPAPVTRRVITTTTTTTANTNTRTQTSRRAFTPLVFRTSPPRAATTAFISPFTTTTEAPPQQCNITERLWVKTVVSIYVRRNRLDSIQRQNLRRGLSQGLRKALNDTSAQAQVETVFGSPNMTVAYHVTGGDVVYSPSVVLDGLNSYGRDKLIADLRQYLPMVTALPLPAALWRPSAATGFQLKTVLQFVGAGDNPRSCRFSQMMERRLEKVFSEAQAKVLSANGRLSVQMLSVTQAAGSPAVSLVYTVSNGTVFLNGTTASNLLGQLSAELVGYFLFYPPLIIAEPLEYHNLNTSVATRDLWVITVIQDVDNVSLEGQYQSFANLMEQRLAELFVLAGQQGTRFRRATAVGSFTVQMVSIRRVSGLRNPAEMTYYVQQHGSPLLGTSAAKVLNTVDSQTMALTLGYFVQLQAEPVVKNPPNNLWIIAAVLAPISVVTLIIIIITAVLCRKNKNDFKADAIGNLNPRAKIIGNQVLPHCDQVLVSMRTSGPDKMAYRRDVGYYHQPVQGFDYAKQHLGQQGGDEETLPVSQDTLVMSLQIRDTPLSLEKALHQDGTSHKKSLSNDKHKSKLPSEDGSVISDESERLNSGRGLTAPKVTAQQKLTKEEARKRDDPYDTSSGSLQLISIKPVAAQPSYSHPASSDRSQDSAIVNGEVNLALKQKSDIEHYRNKLRLKAKRKGYYDFPSTDGSSSSRALAQRQRHSHERAAGEHGRPLEPDDERGSTYVKSHRRHSQVGQTAYRSRQSLSSPSPGGTEMDLLVMRERPRRGIRNSGYDTEPELIEETNVDRLMGPRGYMYGRGLKGHSETSTLSSQPSIDEVRQQMHLLLEEAFSLASGGQSTSGRQSHHHHLQQPPPDHYSAAPPPLPYADVVTSAPGTMSCGRGGLQWVPSYGADVYQCSLPKPAFRFTQLPEMAMDSPPPLPPRTGPPPGKSLRRSTSDLGPKGRSSDTSVSEMQSHHDSNPYGPTTRAALPSITADQPLSNYSGNPITAVYAIPASRSGYSEYFLSTPPTSYHSPSWMSYPPEPEDVPPQWADSLPLPGYVEAFPHPRYPQGSPTRLPLEYKQALDQPSVAPSTASQQSLPHAVKDMDSMPLSSLSTSALVQAIRQEVAKLAKKQNEMFEF